ncbi:hypothetical protein COV49_00690 [Candidatus Falkowbacteria bacterium CG11_big_fil_rev_8_21_14_0_20_39_10]|uniref:Uncharacterized protein n=1 Tax=Candidatus Falkowbacteria bacterium CG11_big_fil_rev_8_21_14_0_20_39_10 TaxID=1974570 RepID=A0A2M6K9V7_9BACT|nr:MAG: hypothetical protein COV49_00690 [Candidatus Falkowbacteria bacterium CG11_big_fil_rev_8_21_14_0_20_39_10]
MENSGIFYLLVFIGSGLYGFFKILEMDFISSVFFYFPACFCQKEAGKAVYKISITRTSPFKNKKCELVFYLT